MRNNSNSTTIEFCNVLISIFPCHWRSHSLFLSFHVLLISGWRRRKWGKRKTILWRLQECQRKEITNIFKNIRYTQNPSSNVAVTELLGPNQVFRLKKCWQTCGWIYIILLYSIENMAKVLACTSVNRVFKIIAWVLEFLWRWVLLVLESSSTQEPLYIRAHVFYLYLRKTGSSST